MVCNGSSAATFNMAWLTVVKVLPQPGSPVLDPGHKKFISRPVVPTLEVNVRIPRLSQVNSTCDLSFCGDVSYDALHGNCTVSGESIMKHPKPWFRKANQTWYVCIRGDSVYKHEKETNE
jgi:hypothetical protein